MVWLTKVKNVWGYVDSFGQNIRTWRTAGQTDGRTDTARRHRPRLCIASRGKKERKITVGVISFTKSQPYFVQRETNCLLVRLSRDVSHTTLFAFKGSNNKKTNKTKKKKRNKTLQDKANTTRPWSFVTRRARRYRVAQKCKPLLKCQ